MEPASPPLIQPALTSLTHYSFRRPVGSQDNDSLVTERYLSDGGLSWLSMPRMLMTALDAKKNLAQDRASIATYQLTFFLKGAILRASIPFDADSAARSLWETRSALHESELSVERLRAIVSRYFAERHIQCEWLADSPKDIEPAKR